MVLLITKALKKARTQGTRLYDPASLCIWPMGRVLATTDKAFLWDSQLLSKIVIFFNSYLSILMMSPTTLMPMSLRYSLLRSASMSPTMVFCTKASA